tara:strand:- start:4008 stop:5570 length:1563 start_codon:yes stop_codon:yes gene_type:complete
MAVASYTTDLVDITQAESLTNFTAIGGGGSGLNVEQEYFIQSTACISKNGWNNTSQRGFIYDAGTAYNVDSGSAIFYWGVWTAPNALNSQSTGGFQCLAGTGDAAFNSYYVRGADTYTYGGWFNIPIDPIAATADTTVGTPGASSNWDSIGVRVIQNGNVTKGSPLGMDAVRHGRRIFVADGEVGAYGTFEGSATANDLQNNRWGLFQAIDGGYLQQGIFQIGTAVTACDFRDSNRSISIANTEKVSPSFNRFEFINTGTNVEWATINISALGTNSRGDFKITDNVTGSFIQCGFADMGTFTLNANSVFDRCTWRGVDKIIQTSGVLDSCVINGSTTVAGEAFIIADTPSLISNCTFEYSAGHAIELENTGTFTFTGNKFTNFTGNNTSGSALFNNSGGAVTASIAGGGGAVTVRNSAGSTTLILNQTAVTVANLKDNTEVRVLSGSTFPQVELAGIENATDGTTNNRSFTFTLDAGVVVDIAYISLAYQNERTNNFTIPGVDTTIPVSQRIDRNYSNPA